VHAPALKTNSRNKTRFTILEPSLQLFFIILMKKFKETGSAELERDHYFNREEPDLDIPDGDIVKGARLFRAHCAR
jgi:hypothetical protein